MKRLVLFTLIFLLIFAGCEQDNQDLTIVKENSVDKENDFLMIPNPEGDGDLEDFDLETIFEGANDDDEVNFLDIVCPEPTPEPIDYESISKDDYRIRSVIEVLKMTKQVYGEMNLLKSMKLRFVLIIMIYFGYQGMALRLIF